jgi:cellulose biosynthesis protein BcsE
VGTPVALAWQSRAPDLQWAQALLQDMLQHGPVVLLAENESAADPLLLHPALAQACALGRLTVWLMAADMVQRRAGMQSVLDELEQAGLSPRHALLVLASPPVHVGHSVAQVQQWGIQIGRWCRTRARPVVFAFNAWDSAEQVLGPLHSLAAVFEHVALMGSQAQHPLLWVERWNGSLGPLFEMRLGLTQDPATRRLAYDGSQMQGQLARLVEAPDQYTVIATRAALAGQRAAPEGWQVVDTLADVQLAAQDAIAATVLLHSGPSGQQAELLRLVHRLRSQHGRALKIVVHETQDKLRANLEQALLHLGANTVVYREVGFARLQRLLHELHDQTFARDIATDFESARAVFMPDALRGYLPMLSFCDSVEAMLARTHSAGLPHSFLRLTMQTHVAHLDAIQASLALRDGDVLSADQNALYVFMFACAETDVDPALARLFAIPPGELFAAQTLYTSVDGMRTALRALREAARLGVPDYSRYCSGLARSPQQVQASLPATVQPSAGDAAPSVQPVPDPPDRPAVAGDAPTPTVHARPLARRVPETEGTPHAV